MGCEMSAASTAFGYHFHVREHPRIACADVSLLASQAGPGARVLDIGCGTGTFLGECGGRLEAVGLELSPQAAGRCRDQGLSVLLADGMRLPFCAAAFQVVRAKEVLEHLADPLAFVRECRRVLRTAGVYLVHVPTHLSILYPVANFWDDYTHVRPFTRKALTRLLEDGGFEVISITGQISGRNRQEQAIGAVLARVFPKRWRALARRIE